MSIVGRECDHRGLTAGIIRVCNKAGGQTWGESSCLQFGFHLDLEKSGLGFIFRAKHWSSTTVGVRFRLQH